MTGEHVANERVGEFVVREDFVLDRVENPHPVMLARALQFRRAAKADDAEGYVAGIFWLGYRDAMADATGCTVEDIDAWLDRHESRVPLPGARPLEDLGHGTRVEIR